MAGSEDHRIHVLLLPYPSQGHINPILQFGKRLATYHGVRSTLAVTRFFLGATKPSPGPVHIAAVSDGCDRGGYDEVGDVATYLAKLELAGSETLDQLLRSESDQGRPVHMVVYDSFLLWAPRVARRHGAACAALFTQACAVDVAYAHVWTGGVELPVREGPVELAGLPAGLYPGDLPTFLVEVENRSAYLDLVVKQCQGLDTADHILINSFYELQQQEAEHLASTWGAKTVGPTVPSAYLDNRIPDDTSYGFHLHTPMTAASKAWLDANPARSVVYVAFGSIATPDTAQMAEVAEGLYNSGKAFLWVVRASEAAKIPDGFAGRVEDRGIIMPWCPQLDVLAHPAIGCFVTHCGWNSTMEALSAGVPMVAMPQWSDQTMNAKYIQDIWHVGARVRPDKGGMVRREEIERRVREVMEGESSATYRKSAMVWREKAKKAMSEGGSSDRNILAFLSKFGVE